MLIENFPSTWQAERATCQSCWTTDNSSVYSQLFRLRHSRPHYIITCFQSCAKNTSNPESLLLQHREDDGASPNCGVKSFVVGKHVLHVGFLARGNRGVSAGQIFTRTVWSCLERWGRRGTSPFVNRTGECILCNLGGGLICFSHEWVNIEGKTRKRERESLHSIRPGGANGRPDIPKKAGFKQGMSQQIRARMQSLRRKPDDLTRKTLCCPKMRGVWGKGEDPRSVESSSEKVGEWSGEFSVHVVFFFFFF